MHANGVVTIFGIRHHGPGSARSLQHALAALAPDAVLVEGPPDAAEVLPLAADPSMHPPCALLIYAPHAPRHAVYYPFAEFSPEWQALQYAAKHQISARFMDLPQRFQLNPTIETAVLPDLADPPASTESQSLLLHPTRDPIGALALAAGYSDGERWWEHMIEQRQNHGGLFEAILEAMTALRETQPPTTDLTELRREAWMRQTIRQALSEGFERIAVVCGAWHAPALTQLNTQQSDSVLLANMPSSEVRATWVPWTYGRLAISSGYGAGVESPGWYEHLWLTNHTAQRSNEVTTRWMTRIARLLRAERLDASSAHVIEAVRLAEALAALRERPLPGYRSLPRPPNRSSGRGVTYR